RPRPRPPPRRPRRSRARAPPRASSGWRRGAAPAPRPGRADSSSPRRRPARAPRRALPRARWLAPPRAGREAGAGPRSPLPGPSRRAARRRGRTPRLRPSLDGDLPLVGQLSARGVHARPEARDEEAVVPRLQRAEAREAAGWDGRGQLAVLPGEELPGRAGPFLRAPEDEAAPDAVPQVRRLGEGDRDRTRRVVLEENGAPAPARKASSSAVDGRPRIALRCGKRPNRSMTAPCRRA